MADYISRDIYLQKLIHRRGNNQIKIITGPRRCGKSWLLKKIYRSYLIKDGISPENIIMVSFDIDDEIMEENLTNSQALKSFLYKQITDKEQTYYVFLDEIQEVDGFERIVNGLNAHENVDVYITGSNSKLLSKDINTIFRGRGDEVRIYPLTFKEFCTNRQEPTSELWKEYYTYGGMPALLQQHTSEQKINYLNHLWNKTYLDDVIERNHIKNRQALESVVDTLCSAIGSLTNPSRISNTLKSIQHTKIDDETVSDYLAYLEDAFLFEGAKRYNIKGHKYYESIKKYYSVDIGLRNAKLNFRQQEITHIMENVIYNELRVRGYLVDVGVVELRRMVDNKSKYVQLEVDFIATNGMEKYYIQSAYAMHDDQKREQETLSLKKIDDSFRKIVIVGDDIASYIDESGITYMGLFQFLKGDKI